MLLELTKQEFKDLLQSVVQVDYDMFKADEERSWSACVYKTYPAAVGHPPAKILESTLNYQKIYISDTYLGITYKTDTRFDENGKYKYGSWAK